MPALVVSPGEADADLPDCTCRAGSACYHTLNAPVAPPDDPCSCPRRRAGAGSCPERVPDEWDHDCANDRPLRCFLRRHAASGKISCSDRLSGECACRKAHPEWCPRCGSDGAEWDRAELGLIRKQVGVERRILGDAGFVLLKSPTSTC